MCRILGAKRGLRNPILLLQSSTAERTSGGSGSSVHQSLQSDSLQVATVLTGRGQAHAAGRAAPARARGRGDRGAGHRDPQRDTPVSSARRRSCHAPVLEGPARGGGRLASARVQDGGGLARSPRSACAGAPCAFWLAQAQVRARWACMCPGRLAAGPPRRFFDPRWIGRVPLPAGRHLGPVAECGCGSACVAVGGGLRRMGRRVVVEVPYLHRWFAVDPVQDFGSRMCGRHRHTATLYYVSFDLCKREAQGGRWRANCC